MITICKRVLFQMEAYIYFTQCESRRKLQIAFKRRVNEATDTVPKSSNAFIHRVISHSCIQEDFSTFTMIYHSRQNKFLFIFHHSSKNKLYHLICFTDNANNRLNNSFVRFVDFKLNEGSENNRSLGICNYKRSYHLM